MTIDATADMYPTITVVVGDTYVFASTLTIISTQIVPIICTSCGGCACIANSKMQTPEITAPTRLTMLIRKYLN